jgi:type VI secretion system protein VasD
MFMANARRLISQLVLAASLLLLIGCPKEPMKVNMTLSAAANLNPDIAGRAFSVVVRVYQLKDKGRFETADYSALWKSDRETLSDDFLDRQERTLQPGAQEILEIRANPLAAYLGVVALYQNPTGDTWRKIVPISRNNQRIQLSLREQNIEIISVGK